MNMTVEARGRAHFVDVAGRVNLETVAALQNRLDALMKEGARSFVLRMVNVADFSSTGIAALLKLQHTIGARGGVFAILEPSPIVEYVLDLSRMRDMFRVYTNEADAVRDFAGRTAGAVGANAGANTAKNGNPQGAPNTGSTEPTVAGAGDPDGAPDPAATTAADETPADEAELFDPLDTRL